MFPFYIREFKGKRQKGTWWSCLDGSGVEDSVERIRASAPEGRGNFITLKPTPLHF